MARLISTFGSAVFSPPLSMRSSSILVSRFRCVRPHNCRVTLPSPCSHLHPPSEVYFHWLFVRKADLPSTGKWIYRFFFFKMFPFTLEFRAPPLSRAFLFFHERRPLPNLQVHSCLPASAHTVRKYDPPPVALPHKSPSPSSFFFFNHFPTYNGQKNPKVE